ncbi:hypothetical protein BLNAU_10077 [Blattamonas nauphoetae]|uniref:Uncharacterized protein n=1 Tax=Blattamonas nauphoetae TaxID=2049346 RepID=A0ABQ9XTY0_9EUKA|nr:hypothetical protein BLNAU_10077 [Blattamonas nauphoetae]
MPALLPFIATSSVHLIKLLLSPFTPLHHISIEYDSLVCFPLCPDATSDFCHCCSLALESPNSLRNDLPRQDPTHQTELDVAPMPATSSSGVAVADDTATIEGHEFLPATL